MIKDIVVNLEHKITRDPARDFAITVAETFDAHIAGVAFAAIERFDAAAKRSLLSSEHRLLKAIGASAPWILATIARRFDLSVFMQSEPDGVDNNDMIETLAFHSGRPLIVVPYIQKDGLKLDRVVCCWDGSQA